MTNKTRSQSNLAKAAPNDPHTHCARRRLQLCDRQTDTQTSQTSVTIVCISCTKWPHAADLSCVTDRQTSVTIVCISCIRCSLKTHRRACLGFCLICHASYWVRASQVYEKLNITEYGLHWFHRSRASDYKSHQTHFHSQYAFETYFNRLPVDFCFILMPCSSYLPNRYCCGPCYGTLDCFNRSICSLILAEFSCLCLLCGQPLSWPAFDTAVFPTTACKSQHTQCMSTQTWVIAKKKQYLPNSAVSISPAVTWSTKQCCINKSCCHLVNQTVLYQ